jgi:hypothetical protein
MKMKLETFQIIIKFTLVFIAVLVVSSVFHNKLLNNIMLILVLPGCITGALLAITNITRREIIFIWKTKKTELHVPFGNLNNVIAYDTEGNKYRMNILLIPKQINN